MDQWQLRYHVDGLLIAKLVLRYMWTHVTPGTRYAWYPLRLVPVTYAILTHLHIARLLHNCLHSPNRPRFCERTQALHYAIYQDHFDETGECTHVPECQPSRQF